MAHSLGEYAKHLREHPEETEKLYDDVLIPVTSFFRDFEAFEALKKQVYPAIVKDKGNKGTIRMRAPGCSTGEETYSLAMTLLEFLGDKAASFQVQIFGRSQFGVIEDIRVVRVEPLRDPLFVRPPPVPAAHETILLDAPEVTLVRNFLAAQNL